MPMATYNILPIDLRAATPAEYAGLNALKNAMRREVLPEDPPWPCEEDMAHFRGMPALRDNTAWVACASDGGQIIALAQADIFLTGDNPRVLWFNIEVLPEARRRGIGRAMLPLIAAQARARGRDLLTVDCHDRAPGGPAFLERIGATRGLVEAMNQVRLADLDRKLVARWLEQRAQLSADFELGFWDVPYPQDRLPDMAALMQEVANDQPRDQLQMEDINYTPELIRQFDDEERAAGNLRWTLYASQRAEGHLAGITEVHWNPNRPGILWQGFTGVMPAHRGRGLGRWLKAEMLSRIFRDRPQVQVIRAGNADSNAPMLGINRALGFQRYVAWTTWQVDLQTVEQYLAAGA